MKRNNRYINELVIIFVIRSLGIIGIAALYSLILFLASCQKEAFEESKPPAEVVITNTSPVTQLIQRVTLNDGSSDNIIDHSSCASVTLPVTVVVNGQKITINSEEDFDLVENIIDDSEDDVEIIFPVTVTLADHTTMTINSEDELEALTKDCKEGGQDDDIECVDFQYPFSISIYNSDNQVSDVVTIADDKDFYEFLDDLEDNDLVSINFPIVMVTFQGNEVEVNDNEELKETIQSVLGECDEDDDNNFHDDVDAEDSTFIAVLTEGEWMVAYFFDEVDKTAVLEEYTLMFNEDGSAVITNGIASAEGKWEIVDHDDGTLHLKLALESELLFNDIDINEEWEVIEFTNTRIALEMSSGDDVMKLTLEKK